jgi:hypothetical protein
MLVSLTYEWTSRHAHPSLYGSAELAGVNALVYGHQYLALSAGTCAIAAELSDLRTRIERRFASVAELQRAEIERLTAA